MEAPRPGGSGRGASLILAATGVGSDGRPFPACWGA